MNIIYIDNHFSCNYYKDIIIFLKKYNNVLLHNNSNINNINNINNIEKDFNADLIIIGFGITNSGNKKPNFNIKTKLPLYIILNKEYTGLKEKLEWAKTLKPKKIFTVHHDYMKYENKINIPFTRIMWSANHNIFKKYDDIYKHDLFFSGVIRKEQTNNLRFKIYENLKKINKFNLFITATFLDDKPSNNNINNNSNTKIKFNNLQYSKNINWSKIVITTTGPADLVGTRYFEIMASNKALIICNRMPKEVYDDIVIDGFNCVMFDNENDFIEKVKYYLDNEDERMKIVNTAYNYFLEKHTWDHKVKHLIDNI
jgi:glycosyltransferase involved in cell wall biosynthesis